MVPRNDLLVKISDILSKHIRRFGIEEDGLTLIGGMVIYFKQMIRPNVENEYWNHIFEGLKMVNQPQAFKAAIGSLGDIGRNFMQSFVEENTRALQILLSLVHENIDRTLKVCIINSIGDICLGLGNKADEFIDDLLSVFNLCFTAIYELQGTHALT